MIAYQIGIFIAIIIASFFGFIPLFTVVVAIILFSISNIFTATLLVMQLTTIGVATIIGIVINIIRVILNLPKTIISFKYYLGKKFNTVSEASYGFLKSFIIVNMGRAGIIMLFMFYVVLIEEVFNLSISSEAAEFIVGLPLIAVITTVILLGNKIKYTYNSLISKSSLTSFIVAIGSMYLGWYISVIIYEVIL